MIVLVALEGQAPALHRVGEHEDRRLGRCCAIERLDHRFKAMPPERGHQFCEPLVVIGREQFLRRAFQVAIETFAPRCAAFKAQRGVEIVRARIDPFAKLSAARRLERIAQAPAVFQRFHTPARCGEDIVETVEHPVRRHRVEGLAVVVDDPPDVAQVVLARLDQRFIDIAFVQFRVAHRRDETAHALGRNLAARGEVVLHEAAERRHRDAQAHGARGIIHVVLVLRTRRIRLCAAERAEPLELFASLSAQHVLDRVKQRARVRLHRDAVLRAQRMEEQRRHDRGHRRARRLVAAHFQAVAAFAEVIGVVDGPRSQPQHALLELCECGEIRRGAGRGEIGDGAGGHGARL
ncbi:MAG: hypothetical protein FD124_633 [Alphaproteobacteria bacterium]|nr:MAG: hypothetical protein FD124_633 [Alphaproteobacteria bacterium]